MAGVLLVVFFADLFVVLILVTVVLIAVLARAAILEVVHVYVSRMILFPSIPFCHNFCHYLC